ncbi:hypothetical protein R9X48_13585 [Lacticaseibacillus rhamnosus]
MQQTNVAAQTAPQTENSSYNKADQGNYAALDSVQLNRQGQLEVSGWHATNAAVNRPNHWLIAYDETTRQELNRIQVQTPVARPDVARVHNVYDAAKSGFHEQLNLTPAAITNGDSITVVSRYTADPAGNGDAVDYWFAPFKIDTRNEAYLEGTKLTDNQLVVSGWHATNQATTHPYHYLILLDQTANGRELGRVKVQDPLARPDVDRIYPLVNNAGQSGFQGAFDLGKVNFNHRLQVISRYSGSAAGNSDYVDYWFPTFGGPTENRANWTGSIGRMDSSSR